MSEAAPFNQRQFPRREVAESRQLPLFPAAGGIGTLVLKGYMGGQLQHPPKLASSSNNIVKRE